MLMTECPRLVIKEHYAVLVANEGDISTLIELSAVFARGVNGKKIYIPIENCV